MKDGGVPTHSFQSPEAMYRPQYYKVMYTASLSLYYRFSPSECKTVQDIEDFVTGACDCKKYCAVLWG